MKDEIKQHFEQNLLDGDEVQRGQMIASTEVLQYLQEVIPHRIVAVLDRVEKEVISSDEEKKRDDYIGLRWHEKQCRNQHRAEQRQKLATLRQQYKPGSSDG